MQSGSYGQSIEQLKYSPYYTASKTEESILQGIQARVGDEVH